MGCSIVCKYNFMEGITMSALGFDNSLSIHPQALLTRAHRSEVLANNLSNGDTPGFKARDIPFNEIIKGEIHKVSSLAVDRTDERHLKGRGKSEYDLMFRVPHQPSIDGNTVDDNYEHGEFTKNAMDYNASFDFLNRKFKGLTRALRGE